MLERVAKYINTFMLPISRVLSAVGLVAMILVVIITVVGVFSRRFFDMPIRGLRDITILGLSIMVFLPMARCTLNDGHISMNIFTSKFPKSLQTIVETIILFIVIGTLSIFTWQLLLYGLRLQESGQTTILLGAPLFPFLYLATLGSLMMTIAFLAKFLSSLDAILRRK